MAAASSLFSTCRITRDTRWSIASHSLRSQWRKIGVQRSCWVFLLFLFCWGPAWVGCMHFVCLKFWGLCMYDLRFEVGRTKVYDNIFLNLKCFCWYAWNSRCSLDNVDYTTLVHKSHFTLPTRSVPSKKCVGLTSHGLSQVYSWRVNHILWHRHILSYLV